MVQQVPRAERARLCSHCALHRDVVKDRVSGRTAILTPSTSSIVQTSERSAGSEEGYPLAAVWSGWGGARAGAVGARRQREMVMRPIAASQPYWNMR